MTVFLRLIRRVIRAGPDDFRLRYEGEILETWSTALAEERRSHGRLATARLGMRGVIDAIATVRRERALGSRVRAGLMTDWWGDVRTVFRGWRRTPGFSATLVVTLALGLGLASAIFAFADGYLFRPSPFPNADRLHFVTDPNDTVTGMLHASDQVALQRSALSSYGFVEWDIASHPVSDGGASAVSGDLIVGDRRVGLFSYQVSPGFRSTVALPIVAGRDFTDADYRSRGSTPAWLMYRYWQRVFGGDPAVLGRSYRVVAASGTSGLLEIVGILGPEVTSFDLNNEPPDAVVPKLSGEIVGPTRYALPIVKLPEGVSREQGEARIASLLQGLAPSADGKPRAVRLRPLHDVQVAGGRPTAGVLFAGALLVLCLASINLLHLLLTRGVARANEVAMRSALGASRWRVTRLFLTESLGVGVMGIAGGLLLGRWLATLLDARIPRYPTAGRNMALVPMTFDWRVIAFASILGLTVALAGGLWPARRALKRSLAVTSRNASGVVAAIPVRVSRSILASELTVATVVMVGTLFIGVGIWRYLHQPLGFDYTDRFWVTVTRSGGPPVAPTEVEAAVRAVRELPGVTAAATRRLFAVRGLEIPGRAVNSRVLRSVGVIEGYFETWSLRLRGGRWFTVEEFTGSAPVAAVNVTLARLAWPESDAIGQSIRVGGVLRQVVGVIDPERTSLAREPAAQAYVPVAHTAMWTSGVAWAPGLSAATMRRTATAAVQAVVPGADVQVEPVALEDLFLRDVGEAQFQAPIVAAFGGLAFLLAGIGVFGLVSYLVEQRTREFGIRLALGARPADVWRSVIRQSVGPAVVGLIAGVGAAWALESVVRSSVFGWPSSGAGAIVGVVVALLAIAVSAAAAPARRAMRIDPAMTLRME